MTGGDWMSVTVTAGRLEADQVISLTLAAEGSLPAWEPGAHVDVRLPSGLVRQYSLCGDPADPAYTIAVLREQDGRGGSAEIHDTALLGRTLEIRGPRNRFRFESAASYVFIAGGIGVTPILPMARAAARAGRPGSCTTAAAGRTAWPSSPPYGKYRKRAPARSVPPRRGPAALAGA